MEREKEEARERSARDVELFVGKQGPLNVHESHSAIKPLTNE